VGKAVFLSTKEKEGEKEEYLKPPFLPFRKERRGSDRKKIEGWRYIFPRSPSAVREKRKKSDGN